MTLKFYTLPGFWVKYIDKRNEVLDIQRHKESIGESLKNYVPYI